MIRNCSSNIPSNVRILAITSPRALADSEVQGLESLSFANAVSAT